MIREGGRTVAGKNKKKQQPNPDQRRYQKLVSQTSPRPTVGRNLLWAFAVGGLVSVVGQGLIDLFAGWMDLSKEEAASPAVAVLIGIAALLTGLGIYDKMGRLAGAGLAVPVTGFANAMVAAALEFKREGLVYGVGGRMFQLAGAVIVFGVVTAFFVGLIKSLLGG